MPCKYRTRHWKKKLPSAKDKRAYNIAYYEKVIKPRNEKRKKRRKR